MARPKTPTLGVKLTHPKAKMPYLATDGAACFDVYAVSKEVKGNTCTFRTGLKFDIPDGYHLQVYSRSGHGFNDSMTLVNSVGIIDSDYTGELLVKLVRQSGDAPWPYVGDRIAQVMLVADQKFNMLEVAEIEETERGECGFGSTGLE